jgi:hypothetical protein
VILPSTASPDRLGPTRQDVDRLTGYRMNQNNVNNRLKLCDQPSNGSQLQIDDNFP